MNALMNLKIVKTN